MDRIVKSVSHVTTIMSSITAASNEQSNGIDHVRQAILDMDAVTQQNAALVEEAAAAAGSMQDQAANLANLVTRFQLSSTSVGGATNRSTMAPVASTRNTVGGRPYQLIS